MVVTFVSSIFLQFRCQFRLFRLSFLLSVSAVNLTSQVKFCCYSFSQVAHSPQVVSLSYIHVHRNTFTYIHTYIHTYKTTYVLYIFIIYIHT